MQMLMKIGKSNIGKGRISESVEAFRTASITWHRYQN